MHVSASLGSGVILTPKAEESIISKIVFPAANPRFGFQALWLLHVTFARTPPWRAN